MPDWTHATLRSDLARIRRECGEIVGEELGLGPFGAGGQADVASVRPSWSNPRPAIWEVKVSRSDFLADVRAGKWERYRAWCERLYFACPAGMVDLREVPAGAGLTIRGPKGWTTRRAAPRNRDPKRAPDLLFSLLLKEHPAVWKPKDRPARIASALATADAHTHPFSGIALSRRVRQAFERACTARDDNRDIEHVKERLLRLLGRDPALAPDLTLHDLVQSLEWRARRSA